jgi:iron complex outermembrane receptor protein
VLQPTNNISVGVDVFNVKIKDILATPSAQEIVSRFRNGDKAYASLVTLQGNDVSLIKSVLSNTGDASVQGVDVFANWRDTFSFGRLEVGLNGTYMDKFDQTSPGGDISTRLARWLMVLVLQLSVLKMVALYYVGSTNWLVPGQWDLGRQL